MLVIPVDALPKSCFHDHVQYFVAWTQPLLQDEEGPTISIVSLEDDAVNPAWCAGAEEQQAVGGASRAQLNPDEPLLCREDPDSLNDEALFPLDYPILSQCRNEILDGNLNMFYGLPDLHNVDLGTPPDLQIGVSLSFWCSRCQYTL